MVALSVPARRDALLAKIDQVEREVTSEWGDAQQLELRAIAENAVRARERLLPKPSLWRRMKHALGLERTE